MSECFKLNKYVLLDRDGTLIVHIHHLIEPEKVALKDGTIEGLQKLAHAGYRFGVITNQSVIERGLATREVVDFVNEKMAQLLMKSGVLLDFVFVCPHISATSCTCRKPMTALGEQAILEFEIDVDQSYMVGDRASDIEFGATLGLRTILIHSNSSQICKPDLKAKNILDCSRQILARLGKSNDSN